jgi:hypothetical protein
MSNDHFFSTTSIGVRANPPPRCRQPLQTWPLQPIEQTLTSKRLSQK